MCEYLLFGPVVEERRSDEEGAVEQSDAVGASVYLFSFDGSTSVAWAVVIFMPKKAKCV